MSFIIENKQTQFTHNGRAMIPVTRLSVICPALLGLSIEVEFVHGFSAN